MSEAAAPEITHLEWGQIRVRLADGTQRFKDCLIWPTGAQEWDWKETGTSHQRGIQLGEVKLLLDRGAEEIILSTGQQRRLRVAEGTEKYLERENIPYHVKETTAAVELFNQLVKDGRAAGGLFHSTC